MKIAIDVDNTLVDYRKSTLSYLEDKGMSVEGITHDSHMSSIKKNIKSNFGDRFWQDVQAYIYSDTSSHISFYKNSDVFIRDCFSVNAEIYIISHKTKYGLHFSSDIDIRSISINRLLSWLNTNNLGGCIKSIIFADTFDQKIEYLKMIDPLIIIDDLKEIHNRISSFRCLKKKNTKKYINILFQGNHNEEDIKLENGIYVSTSWLGIKNFLLKE